VRVLKSTVYLKEVMEIFKDLSTENQIYMLTLARVAFTSERTIKNETKTVNDNCVGR